MDLLLLKRCGGSFRHPIGVVGDFGNVRWREFSAGEGGLFKGVAPRAWSLAANGGRSDVDRDVDILRALPLPVLLLSLCLQIFLR